MALVLPFTTPWQRTSHMPSSLIIITTGCPSSTKTSEVPFGRPQALGDREASLAKLVGSRLHVPMCWD
ncbi:hypothetical protein LSAT2_012144 [Lamellibrachia satsuma]|nr:hypothetical protein LSAT2_012144 [Lamellibrachia satsuma]